MSKTYNGHRNWNHWNVSLWLNNDEHLWREMIHFISYAKRKADAARMMLDSLRSTGITHTPDGAPYSASAIYHAMAGWEA